MVKEVCVKEDIEYKVIGKGESILILETGIGSPFYDWYSLLDEIKEYFTIVVYHRAGYGKSQASNNSRTTKNIAEELNYLMEQIGIKDEFILMGHSFGGLCVQQYVKMYPSKIKAVVLLDSTSYNFKQLYKLNIPVMNSLIDMDKMIESNIDSSRKSKEEIRNKYEDVLIEYKKILSDSEFRTFQEFIINPLLYKTKAEEFKNWDVSSEDVMNGGKFPDIPLIVIARDNKVAERYWINLNIPEEEAVLYESVWRALQVELSKLSNKGELIIADNSDHEIYLDRPDIIIDCLKKLI